MFPKTDTVLTRVETPAQTGTRSYLFDFNKGDFVVRDGKLVECDGMDALKVWIEKILKTEKGRYRIYDGTGYGCQLEDLIIGNTYTLEFTEAELKREVEEAILKNPLVISVSNFTLTKTANALTIQIEVKTNDTAGDIITVTI
ncbi:DUF2634 domain-containing protein [Ructibacterium gallinarum]|uniref:DUF2634 domain-containing protein n=1 Tax=Ructibacterium gallinarum TaxID=2779355 RepID=A0A9D5RB96_9FIRM|nr:DUF2634 domain-containing protein [Ructibacterium gallinarum]MBE5039808.1 DUF2634 domain-containing protein [Ructibacterium gallinarum]DAY68408.1 MAG TPA: Protein of unknown function (DUF2634) [Caudoviricetes sp.]